MTILSSENEVNCDVFVKNDQNFALKYEKEAVFCIKIIEEISFQISVKNFSEEV